MKFLFFFLFFFVSAYAYVPELNTNVRIQEEQKLADKDFLIRQRNLLRLLEHVHTVNAHQELANLGREYHLENNVQRYKNPRVVKEFLLIQHEGLLPRGKIFSITNERQREEAIALFHLFYYAADWETLLKTASWARDNINEGVFVYALTVAVLHRRDTQGMVLPPLYEIYPNYFINSEVVQKANRLKIQERITDPKLAEFYGIHKVDNTFFINSNYSGWYTRVNHEQTLSYFTEDIGLNSYYYYFHADYPFWMGGEEYGLKKDRRGELYYYFHQQLLARYYLERLSNDMGEIPRFWWTKPIRTGFTPSLKYLNGLEFPSRPNNYDVKTDENQRVYQEVVDHERRIRDAIKLGYVITEDGSHLSLRKPEDIEVLGRIIQSNEDNPNKRYYSHLMVFSKILLGKPGHPMQRYFASPSALQHFETALRDPIFYQLYSRLIHWLIEFKDQLPSYTREEINFAGVKIEDVSVDKLVTYYDTFDVDVTNMLYRKGEEIDQNKDNFIYKASQQRLNHSPFSVKINIDSETETDAIIRIFLGPKRDGSGHLLNLNENRMNFFKLDQFLLHLKSGKNVINRNSINFHMKVKDRTSARDLMQNIEASLVQNDHSPFVLDMSEAHNGFPQRLILPRGKKGGMPFQLYIVVSPHVAPKVPRGTGFDRAISAGVGSGARWMEDRAFGYPLDRKIHERTFITPNMYMKDVIIFHKEQADIVNMVPSRHMENIDI